MLKQKKGLEFKILMMWIFILLAFFVVIMLIAVFSRQSKNIVTGLGDLF